MLSNRGSCPKEEQKLEFKTLQCGLWGFAFGYKSRWMDTKTKTRQTNINLSHYLLVLVVVVACGHFKLRCIEPRKSKISHTGRFYF